MNINSITFGSIDINDDTVYTFPDGIPGLRGVKKYVILDREDAHPYRWLQAVEAPFFTLMIVDPAAIVPEYELTLQPEHLERLQLTKEEEAYFFCVVTLPEQYQDLTANLRAPLVLNTEKRLGLQVEVDGPDEWLKFRVYPVAKEQREG